MGKNIKILLVISAVVALVCYTYYLNPQMIEVTTAPGNIVSVPLAILMLTLVLAGAIVSALISLFVTTRMKFKIWALEKNLEKINSAESSIRKARGLIALDMLEEAISLLKKVVHNHHFQHSARALLIKALRKSGRSAEALELLSSSRIENADTELLTLFAEINLAEGNNTAAYDNLSLVLKNEPGNLKALSLIVTAAENLSLVDEAISFQEQIIRILKGDARELAQLKLANLELKRGIRNSKNSEDELLKEIERVLQRHRDFPAALAERANILFRRGDLNSAVRDLSKAYENSHETDYMVALLTMCLDQQIPHQALQAIDRFTDAKDSEQKHPLLLLLRAQLLLHLEMVDLAKELVKKLRGSNYFAANFSQQLLVIESIVARRVGKFELAIEKLNELENIPQLPGDSIFPRLTDKSAEGTNTAMSRLKGQNIYAAS